MKIYKYFVLELNNLLLLNINIFDIFLLKIDILN